MHCTHTIPLDATSGHISSFAARQECGDRKTSWMIKSSPGQQVNISLIDFGYNEEDKKRCFGWVQQFKFYRGNSKFTILPYPFKFCISFSSFISLCLIS